MPAMYFMKTYMKHIMYNYVSIASKYLVGRNLGIAADPAAKILSWNQLLVVNSFLKKATIHLALDAVDPISARGIEIVDSMASTLA